MTIFQRIWKNVKRILRNGFYLILIGVLLIAGIYVGILMNNDLHGNEAKKYLIEKYGLEEKDLFVEKYNEYVYKDVANCDTLWAKKCTDDKDLAAKYYFKVKSNGDKIVVTEDSDAVFSDDYDAETTKEWKEKEERQKEIERQREEQQKKDYEESQKKNK